MDKEKMIALLACVWCRLDADLDKESLSVIRVGQAYGMIYRTGGIKRVGMFNDFRANSLRVVADILVKELMTVKDKSK